MRPLMARPRPNGKEFIHALSEQNRLTVPHKKLNEIVHKGGRQPDRDLRDRRLAGATFMISASLERARASCAFTVPSGMPKTRAASLGVNPSMCRS